MRPILLFALLAMDMTLGLHGRAQAQTAPQGPCYEISAGNPNLAPYSPILIDKCTGKTWILSKVTLREGKQDCVFRWSPVRVGDESSESVFRLP
jgi:hypothetical protein